MNKKNPDIMLALLLVFGLGIVVTGAAHETLAYQSAKTANLTASVDFPGESIR